MNSLRQRGVALITHYMATSDNYMAQTNILVESSLNYFVLTTTISEFSSVRTQKLGFTHIYHLCFTDESHLL